MMIVQDDIPDQHSWVAACVRWGRRVLLAALVCIGAAQALYLYHRQQFITEGITRAMRVTATHAFPGSPRRYTVSVSYEFVDAYGRYTIAETVPADARHYAQARVDGRIPVHYVLLHSGYIMQFSPTMPWITPRMRLAALLIGLYALLFAAFTRWARFLPYPLLHQGYHPDK